MKTITKPVYGPDMLKFEARYSVAENLGELESVAKEMGLGIDDANEALRQAKKRQYTAALESTPQSKLDALVTAAVNAGFSREEAEVMAESRREKIQNTLPAGLTPVYKKDEEGNPTKEQVVGKPRGRAAASAATPVTA